MDNYVHDPNIHNLSAAKQILPYVLKLKPVNSILDIGCGTGTWLAVAKNLGVEEITGIDGAKLKERDLKIPFENFINTDLSLSINLQRKFDLVICLEVAEHLSEDAAEILVSSLVQHGDLILFSAAIPGQGGQNHLNEQWPAYWQKIFASHGYQPSTALREFFWENNNVEWWYRQNILIYGTKSDLEMCAIPISQHVNSLVHPDLLNEKLDIIEKQSTFINSEVWNPSFISSLKRLVKSIIK